MRKHTQFSKEDVHIIDELEKLQLTLCFVLVSFVNINQNTNEIQVDSLSKELVKFLTVYHDQNLKGQKSRF